MTTFKRTAAVQEGECWKQQNKTKKQLKEKSGEFQIENETKGTQHINVKGQTTNRHCLLDGSSTNMSIWRNNCNSKIKRKEEAYRPKKHRHGYGTWTLHGHDSFPKEQDADTTGHGKY